MVISKSKPSCGNPSPHTTKLRDEGAGGWMEAHNLQPALGFLDSEVLFGFERFIPRTSFSRKRWLSREKDFLESEGFSFFNFQCRSPFEIMTMILYGSRYRSIISVSKKH